MTEGSQAPLPDVELAAAAAANRLGRALLAHTVDPELSAEVATTVAALAERIEQSSSARTKAESFRRYAGHQRIEHFAQTGEWPGPPPEGGPVAFDVLSFVGGALNPFSAGARYWRCGDEAHGAVTFARPHEGPPDRAHGGALAAVFDEVMSSVFRVRSMASAFTGSLAVRYLAPAPAGTEIGFRAWLTSSEGRKHTVEAEATADGVTVATASAIFIEMSAEHLALAISANSRQPDRVGDE